MAFKIIWSEEAHKTFAQNLDYLKREWSDKEIENFTHALNQIIERIKNYPESFPSSQKEPLIRRAKINKYITLYFRYNSNNEQLHLITFWHSKQDPGRLKY